VSSYFFQLPLNGSLHKDTSHAHLVLVPAVFQSFYCNYIRRTLLQNGQQTFLKPSMDNWEVFYVVKSTSKRNFSALHDSKLDIRSRYFVVVLLVLCSCLNGKQPCKALKFLLLLLRIQVERLMTSVMAFVITVDWLRCEANCHTLLGGR